MKPSGNIKYTHDFKPFSVELLPAISTESRIKYTGPERDNFTNFDYMHFRFYASSTGRFLKPDNIIPDITNPQNWNGYSYVKGNPINFNDPLGHFTNVPHGTKAILYGPGGELMPTAFEYGGDWISIEIFEFFGVKPIYITLNVVIDETMSEEEKIEAKAEFEDQLTKANSVYNKIGIYLSAEVSEGVVPKYDPNSTPKEFKEKCFSMSPSGRITVFISNYYKGSAADVSTKTRTGFVLLAALNETASIWHLAHELGHVFGFRFGPKGQFANTLNDFMIESFILYVRYWLPLEDPFPVTMLSVSLWLRYNANVWGK